MASADTNRVLDPIGDYTVQLPHASKLQITLLERGLLKAYLDNPRDVILTEILAVYNLQKLYEENKAAEKKKAVSGQSIKYSVLSLYFLNRVKDLGFKHYWVTQQIQKVETALNKTLDGRGRADANEKLESVLYYRDAFTNNEQNRYIALDKLLDSMVKYPENAFVNFYYMAGNTWNFGEEAYDEPGIKNIILASYFATRSFICLKKLNANGMLIQSIMYVLDWPVLPVVSAFSTDVG